MISSNFGRARNKEGIRRTYHVQDPQVVFPFPDPYPEGSRPHLPSRRHRPHETPPRPVNTPSRCGSVHRGRRRRSAQRGKGGQSVRLPSPCLILIRGGRIDASAGVGGARREKDPSTKTETEDADARDDSSRKSPSTRHTCGGHRAVGAGARAAA
jgi:hypothetical protein